MLAKELAFEQGSHEWLVARIPYVTASNVAKVMAKGSGATRQNYMVKMICEILSGQPTKSFKSKYMQDGNDNEPMAREIYEKITGNTIKESGFWYIEEEKLGGSVDGDIVEDPDGIIEIKNVIPAEQVRLLTTGKIKGEYLKQIQTNLYVREKKFCDYIQVSLGDEENGELPDEYKVKIIRVYRDEVMIQQIRKEVAFFHHDLKKLMAQLKGAI